MTTVDETPTPPEGTSWSAAHRARGASSWSARPGGQLAVLGHRIAVVLPGSQVGLAAALWPRVDAGAGLDEVLDLLLAAGFGELPDVIVVAHELDGQVTVLARGHRFRVEVLTDDSSSPVVVDGTSVRTWAERSFGDVTSLAVTAEGQPGGDEQGEDERPPGAGWVGTGVVRASGVALQGRPATEAERPVGADRPPLRGHAVPAGPVEPPQPRRPAEDPDDARDRHEPPPPEPLSPAVAILAFGDGSRVAVDQVVLVGRAPTPRNRPSGRPPRTVAVTSPQLAVSATHLEVRPGTGPDEGRAVVTDLGSTNGTVLAPPDSDPEELTPGVGARLEPGAVVHLGDGVLFEVLRP